MSAGVAVGTLWVCSAAWAPPVSSATWGLVDVNVEVPASSVQTGALAGVAYGRIASSYVAGRSVTGGWGVGGLVGALTGATGTVVASYTNVSVSAATFPPHRAKGGLIGGADGMSVVSASYSIGEVQATGNQNGGLIGSRGSSVKIQSSYFDRGRTAQIACCGTNVPSPDRSSKTSAELYAPTSAMGIYAGWDKLNVDGVDQGGDGDLNDDAPWDFGTSFDYPVLRQGRTEAAVRAQHSGQPAITLTPTFDGDATVSEGTNARYVVSLPVPVSLPSGVSASWGWSVGSGAGISAGDFADATVGRVGYRAGS